MVLPLAARLAAWYYRPLLLRTWGYGRAAEQLSRLRRARAWAAGGVAAAAAAAGAALKFSRKRSSPEAVVQSPMPRLRRRPRRARRLARPVKRRRFADPVVEDESGYVQHTRLKNQVLGRSLSQAAKFQKLLSSKCVTRIDRWGYLRGLSVTSGAFPLSFNGPAVVANGDFQSFPFYTFDLTCLQATQATPTTSDAYFGIPMLRLQREHTTGTFTWDRISTLNHANVSVNQWDIERTPIAASDSTNDAPREKVLHEWFDIRFQAWGATALPSSCDVMLCYFPEENRSPPSYEYFYGAPGSYVATHPIPDKPAAVNDKDSQAYSEYQSFWSNQTDTITYNPLNLRGTPAESSGMKVVWHKRINFNPTASFETCPTGHQYSFKIFKNADMLCSYRHPMQQGTIGGVNDFEFTAQQTNPYYEPIQGNRMCRTVLRNRTSRLFLVIKGLATKYTTEPSAADNASFDLMVRRKVSMLV